MAAKPVLTVVVVRDRAFRHALGRRLAISGVHVVTPEALAALDRRPIRQPVILLTGETAVAGPLGDRIAREWQEGRWRRVAMLTVDSPIDASNQDWQVFGSVSDTFTALFAEWASVDSLPHPENSLGARSPAAA